MAVGSAASMVLGHSWAGTAIASVQPLLGEPGILTLRVADFPPLQSSFGAVRLAFASLGQVSPMLPFIVAKDDSDFFAMTAECTHAGCLIPAFNATKLSTCPCHGSRFGHDGRVVRGPANAPLPRYEVESPEPGVVRVFLPEIDSYEVAIQRVVAPSSPSANRLALRFRSMRNVDYEILGRRTIDAPWEVQAFALTEDGPANQTSVRGTGSELVVHLDGGTPAALFVPSAKVKQV
ncbi:MAG: ubiquinol-cytochrome c reductase iron-sulfur subunit [Limisphaerales bacterium]